MTSAGDVLDSIDGTLRDYETSADAMRWTPDPPPVTVRDETERVYLEWNHVISAEALTEFGRQISAMFSQMTAAPGAMSVPLAKMAAAVAHARAAQDRKHRIRCRTCNPAGNPPPFPGGAEYHRRQKARARRRRRG